MIDPRKNGVRKFPDAVVADRLLGGKRQVRRKRRASGAKRLDAVAA
jgi:hypothetical protein